MQYFENKSLKNYTSLKIGGIVKKFYLIETIFELQNLFQNLSSSDRKKLKILGGGTNLLINDEGVLDFIVVKLAGDFVKINISEDCIIAGSGAFLNDFVKKTIGRGFGGLEIFAGIPGTIGGAVAGNAGSKYGDISRFIKSVQTMNYEGKIENLAKKDIIFTYRKTNLSDQIILNVEFEKSAFENSLENNQKFLEKFRFILDEKISTQPYNLRTLGCVFKNPKGFSIGKIIDELGLKSKKIGDAFISEKHANFFANEKNAKFADFFELINFVKNKVKTEKNLDTELEIKIWR